MNVGDLRCPGEDPHPPREFTSTGKRLTCTRRQAASLSPREKRTRQQQVRWATQLTQTLGVALLSNDSTERLWLVQFKGAVRSHQLFNGGIKRENSSRVFFSFYGAAFGTFIVKV